jgi:hypothetical protein
LIDILSWRDRFKEMTGKNTIAIRLKVNNKRIYMPEQTHPCCSSGSFKNHLGATPATISRIGELSWPASWRLALI